ncbi:MAG: TVP38/TMEM64 family protein [Thermoanaerobaculia bacterium]|nr:TVP38/TMEM64 family protein [Thermoanaerobaculia bacterium]
MEDEQKSGDDAAEVLRPDATRRKGGSRPIAKIVGVAVALVALFFLGRELGGYVPHFAEWVDGLGIWGPTVFAVGYALATVAFVPGSILTMAAGAIFGLWQGTLVVFLGATVGTALAFLLARYVARSAIERKLAGRPRFATIDRAVSGSGLKIVFLLRLSPIFPYNLLNYALGLTSVRFLDYVVASLGMLPGTFLYVYYGKVLGSLAAVTAGAEVERGIGQWVLLGVGLVATVVVTTVVTRIARKALRDEVVDQDEDEADDE